MIRLRNLCLSFGEKRVLERFSMDLPDTGVSAMTGPSGCGKTTLLRCLAGLERPLGEIEGVSAAETALMFQEDRLLPWRSAEEQLLDVLPRNRRERAKTLLRLVGLEGEGSARPGELSGGMCRRLALARCLALDARLYLLDEPFAGVDTPRAVRLMEHLRRLNAPVLLVSHQPELLSLAHRVIALDGPPLKAE